MLFYAVNLNSAYNINLLNSNAMNNNLRVKFQVNEQVDSVNRLWEMKTYFGYVIHFGIACESHNRGDGMNIAVQYSVAFVARDDDGKVFEVMPIHLIVIF